VEAQKFIHKNDLPQVYLEQVANFICTNANLIKLPAAAGTHDFADPFTGEGRYVPTSNGNADVAPAVNVNFRERGAGSSAVNVDPFTSGDSYSSGKQEFTVKRHIPCSTMVTFDAYDASKISSKLKEFNGQLEEHLKASDAALEAVVSLIDKADQAAISTLEAMLSWPEAKLFPVLDVVRLIVRDEDTCSMLSPKFIEAIMKNLTSTAPNQLMSIRALSNITNHAWGKNVVEKNVVQIAEQISKITQGNANLQTAIATFFLNQSILQKTAPSDEICTTITIGVIKFLELVGDPQATFRAYQALGNMITFNSTALSIAKSVDPLKTALERNRGALHELGEISVELSEKLL